MYRQINDAYVPYIIKEYLNWTLLIHDNQSYLGRAYVWSMREAKIKRLSDISNEDRDELWRIIYKYKEALDTLWSPDHMNFEWRGNDFKGHGGHGHIHLIPRYASERRIDQRIFTDSEWGREYDHSRKWEPEQKGLFATPDKLLLVIQTSIAAQLT